MKKRVSQVHSFSAWRKKGTSHLGFVLSFVIFILFLVFILSIIEPRLGTQTNKQPLLDSLEFNMINSFGMDNFTIATLNYKGVQAGQKNCISSNPISSLEFISDANKNKIKIRDDLGNSRDFDIRSNVLYAGIDSTSNAVLKIYYAQNISSSTTALSSCKDVSSSLTVQSVNREQKYILDSNIISLREKYAADYGKLKTDLAIPGGNDFTFSFKLANGSTVEPQGVTIPTVNVFAKNFPVQYLDNNANLNVGFLTVKIW